MFTLMRDRLLAALAVLTLCCVSMQQMAGSVHALMGCPVDCCEAGAGETGGHGDVDGAGGGNDDGNCPHAYCCHGGAAVAEGGAVLGFDLQVAPHEVADVIAGGVLEPVGIEYPPRLG